VSSPSPTAGITMQAWNKAGKGMAGMEARHQEFCSTSTTACHPPSPTWPPPSPRTGSSPPDPPRLVGRVHLQLHHPLLPGRLRIGGR
jgi:hypothetical protein